MNYLDVIIESINKHIWNTPAEERDPETLQFAAELLADLSAAGYEIRKTGIDTPERTDNT